MRASASEHLRWAIVAALAVAGCNESQEAHVSYVPGTVRLRATGETWPELPCLPRQDARLGVFDASCDWEEFEVIAGPRESADDGRAAACNYRISYTPRDQPVCIVGRPLVDDGGRPRTAALVANAAWSRAI